MIFIYDNLFHETRRRTTKCLSLMWFVRKMTTHGSFSSYQAGVGDGLHDGIVSSSWHFHWRHWHVNNHVGQLRSYLTSFITTHIMSGNVLNKNTSVTDIIWPNFKFLKIQNGRCNDNTFLIINWQHVVRLTLNLVAYHYVELKVTKT